MRNKRNNNIITISAIFMIGLISCISTITRMVEKKEYRNIQIEEINGEIPEEDFILWLGHSSFVIKLKGIVFYTDPILTDKVVIIKRLIKLPVDIEKLPAPDFVVISHNHYDHMDIPSLKILEEKAKNEGKKLYVFVPKRASYYLKGMNFITVELPWGSKYKIKDLEITSIKVKHFSGRNLFDWNFSLWNAYLIASDNFKVLFMGDTAYTELPYLEPDLSLAPIGAWKPRWFMKRNHVSPCEAVRMSYETGAKLMIPMHYGTFRQGADTPEESILNMEECAKEIGLTYYVAKPGEILTLTKIASLSKKIASDISGEKTKKD